jgi:phenylalanyl-tRNA synthetase beta chain
MKILYSWLKDYISLNESPEKLAEILSLRAFETSVLQKIGIKDAVFDVEIFPNRVGDAASYFGLARELSMILRRPLKVENPLARLSAGRKWPLDKARDKKIETSKLKAADFVSVKVLAKDLCPRYSARAVMGVKVGPSPLWLKKRLFACGLRPINNVVDITNYVMLELGEPLHAFDLDKIADSRGSQADQRGKNISVNQRPNPRKSALIIVRRARKGEVIDALDEKTYQLTEDDLVIADGFGKDSGNVLALAGIKGGKRAEIDKNTKNVVLEAANFDAIAIRKTSKRLGLRTDSSWRFENGMDPNLTAPALDRASQLIAEIAGGRVANGIVDVYPRPVVSRPIIIDLKRLQSLIGLAVSAQEVISLLKPILEQGKVLAAGKLLLRPVTARRDLQYPEDIAEEIARLIGYQNLTPKPALAVLAAPSGEESLRFREILRDWLAAMGFSEVYNYSFTGERDIAALKLDAAKHLQLENPLTSETAYLKREPFVGILKNVRDNLRFFDTVRIFEIAKSFAPALDGAAEEWRLSGAVSRKESSSQEIFFEAKGAIESLLQNAGLDKDDYIFTDLSDDGHLAKGSSALLKIGNEAVGKVGLFRQDYARVYNIGAPLAHWTLKIDSFFRAAEEEREFEPFSKYPDVSRDISILAPSGSRVDDVEGVIENSGAKHLADIDLFDIYEGEDLPDGKTAMAFHLIFRDPDRTLTEEEVNREMEKINKALKAFGAEIR